MGRAPCCDKQGLKKGPWTPEEDEILVEYIKRNGHGSWRSLPNLAGLLRCGKSCRLRWTNYLRPDIKRGPFTTEEEKTIIQLHGILGNRWSSIASQLPGRTDNEIKNFWNTHLKKRLLRMGLDPHTHAPSSPSLGHIASSSASPTMRHMAQWESARLEAEARLSQESLFFAQCDPGPTFLKTEPDYFLRIWNSDVGESFRTFGASGRDTSMCRSPVSPASSTTKYRAAGAATVSTVTNDRCEDLESKSCGSDADNSLSSLDDSSETSLQLLLDFPEDEMGYLQGQIGNLSTMFPTE